MKRTAILVAMAVLTAVPLVTGPLARGASAEQSPGAGVDVKAIQRAPVESGGQRVGKVEHIMVNPQTGQIDSVQITMTKGRNRTISVPWGSVTLARDQGGKLVLNLSEQALQGAGAASPSTAPPPSR